MRAVVYVGFGSPEILQSQQVERPKPRKEEILIKVCAAALNPLDWKMMKGGPPLVRLLLGVGKPKLKRPGVDVAGVVDEIGEAVTQFKPGDAVFGTCVGAFAEYATSAPAFALKSVLVKKPDNVTFEQAACVPVAGLTALQGLRDKGRVLAGQKVLINGAAGGVGTFAVQMAKVFGADVTGVCSTGNLQMVRSLGADRAIDYTQQDFTQTVERYDVILDCVGNRSLADCRRALTPSGRLVLIGAPDTATRILARTTGAAIGSCFGRQKMVFFIARVNPEDLSLIGRLMSDRQVIPVIDRRYTLSEAAEAFRYLEHGHARGKVVITPDL